MDSRITIISQRALKYFMVGIAVIICIMLPQTLYNYSDVLFYKNIGFSTGLSFVVHSLIISGSPYLPYAFIFSAAFLYYGSFKRMGGSKNSFRRDVLPIALLAMVLFFFSGWTLPSLSLKYMSMVYELKTKKPDEPIKPLPEGFFSNNAQTRSLSDLYEGKNLLEQAGAEKQETILDLIGKIPFSQRDSVFSLISFIPSELQVNAITAHVENDSAISVNEQAITLNQQISDYQQIESAKEKTTSKITEIWLVPVYSFLFILLGILGGAVFYRLSTIKFIGATALTLVPIELLAQNLPSSGFIPEPMGHVLGIAILLSANIFIYFRISKMAR